MMHDQARTGQCGQGVVRDFLCFHYGSTQVLASFGPLTGANALARSRPGLARQYSRPQPVQHE